MICTSFSLKHEQFVAQTNRSESIWWKQSQGVKSFHSAIMWNILMRTFGSFIVLQLYSVSFDLAVYPWNVPLLQIMLILMLLLIINYHEKSITLKLTCFPPSFYKCQTDLLFLPLFMNAVCSVSQSWSARWS